MRRALLAAALVVLLALVAVGVAVSRRHPSGPAGRTVNQTGTPVAGLGATAAGPGALGPGGSAGGPGRRGRPGPPGPAGSG